MRGIPAALLDQRVTIQHKQVTRNAFGEEMIAWVDDSTVWAQVVPLSGREYIAMRQAQSDVSVRFRMRYIAGLTSAHRLYWRNQAYSIVDVIDTDNDGAVLEVLGFAETVPT